MKYKIPISFQCKALLNVEANTLEEAQEKAYKEFNPDIIDGLHDVDIEPGSLTYVVNSVTVVSVQDALEEMLEPKVNLSQRPFNVVDFNQADAAYLQIVENALQHGSREENRTGIGTIALFAEFYKLDLSYGLPILTTKQVNFNAVLRELLWYISGEPHIKNLRKHTSIWNQWADKDGNLETAYGRYWTHYPLVHPYPGGTITAVNNNELFWEGHPTSYFTPDYKEVLVGQGNPYVHYETRLGWGFNQLAYIEEELKLLKKDSTRHSKRRLVLTAWHPGNATVSKLPPCHLMAVFSIIGNKLSCHLTQRSGDLGLGIPFNMTCYSLLTIMLANSTGYEYGQFAHTIVDAHVYENHIIGLKEQLQRNSYPLPQISVPTDKSIFALRFDDFKLIDYQYHPAIKLPVAV